MINVRLIDLSHVNTRYTNARSPVLKPVRVGVLVFSLPGMDVAPKLLEYTVQKTQR